MSIYNSHIWEAWLCGPFRAQRWSPSTPSHGNGPRQKRSRRRHVAGCVSMRNVTTCTKYKSLAGRILCQQDGKIDQEWHLVDPQKAQHMLNYVTKSFVSGVWPWKLAQAGDETFKDVLTEWHLREDADWLVVDVPQEVQHSFKLQVTEFQACSVDFGLGELTAFCPARRARLQRVGEPCEPGPGFQRPFVV